MEDFYMNTSFTSFGAFKKGYGLVYKSISNFIRNLQTL